jgi:hypothetical protein
MPITGRNPAECFRAFEAHVRTLVAATITDRAQVHARYLRGESRAVLAFMEGSGWGELLAVPLKTRLGTLYFYLGQSLEAVEEAGRYRLRTREYWYRLLTSTTWTDQALIRWEYKRDVARDAYCRHHVQMPLGIPIEEGEFSLNKGHLPTGWVTMEEIIRFLIVDLEIAPPCGATWPDALEKSERKFYEEFTGKRYTAPTEAA